MGSPKETKTPVTEVDKTIDVNESNDTVCVETWMAKSDEWTEKTDDKLKALTDVLLETRDLVRSLTRHLDSRNSEEPEEEVVNDEEGDQPENKVRKSLKELKKFLGRFNGLNDSDGDEQDDEVRASPVLAPKLKDPKEEPSDSSPAKPAAGKSSRGTPTSKLAKGKREYGDATKPASGSALKKIKSETDVKPGGGSKITPSSAQGMAGALSAQGPFKEEEIRAVLLQRAPLTTSELVATFRARLKSYEDKKAFTDILKRISKIKTSNNRNYVVLK